MRVPIKVDYGVRALVDLAVNGKEFGPVRSVDMSKRTAIPKAYLAQVLYSLRVGGFVKSTRGPGGGHRLGRNASEIKISDVMHCLDGKENLVKCFKDDCFCSHVPMCAQREVWMDVEKVVFNLLESISIDDLAKKTFKMTTEINFR
tara:strand:+ start:2140 stop:2577 length:438 start_codon:yes stop_codon:yes gene_type:complete